MKWYEERKQIPNRCVLVESLIAKTEDNERVIEEMSVIDDFDNGNAVWKVYPAITTQATWGTSRS